MKNLLLLPLLLLSVSCVAGTGDESAVVEVAEEKKLDFGDYSSGTLTGKAWASLEAKKYDDTITFAKECIEKYKKEAIEMQDSLTEPVSASDKDAVFAKWALNDVGTCYFIKGQALEKQDKGAEATKAYKKLLETVSFAQCWDAKGWFWKPADAATKQIKMLEFELLDSGDDDADTDTDIETE